MAETAKTGLRGIPVYFEGEWIFFVPIETGPAGLPKVEALEALLRTESKKAEDTEAMRSAINRFVRTLLEPNYTPGKVEEIANRIPTGWAKFLAHLAVHAEVSEEYLPLFAVLVPDPASGPTRARNPGLPRTGPELPPGISR